MTITSFGEGSHKDCDRQEIAVKKIILAATLIFALAAGTAGVLTVQEQQPENRALASTVDRQARLSNTCKGIASPFFQSGDDVITSARPEPAVNHVREICFLFTKRPR